ncbi:MAG: cysteine--tRNA ligase [Deinococcota bacterium]
MSSEATPEPSTLKIYNTLSRQKETFTPLVPGMVGMYSCGPTVYSEPHLGHARGPVVLDVVRRWFEHEGYRVRLVYNITDVGHLTDDGDEGEDKMLKRAKLEKLEPMEVAEKYFWKYFDNLAKLQVRRPDIVPRASGHIPEQIELTQALLDAGHAYEVNGSVYFDVSSWPDYGELSGRNTDDALEGTRVEVRSEKRNPQDFALWKRAEPNHIMRWNSPWGEGFPGWHIECSAMSTKYLGDEFDIHGGGLDLTFPHHECEIAQAKAAGKGFARYWIHWNFITLSGEKMAKSKGHFVTLEELLTQNDPQAVRFHLLNTHYRTPSDFSPESLQASAQGLKRIQESQREVSRLLAGETPDLPEQDPLARFRERFQEGMNDDFNTPQAIAALFDGTREINAHINTQPEASFLAAAQAFYKDLLDNVLGLPLTADGPSHSKDTLDGLVGMIAEQRQKARLARDFRTADGLRKRLAELGVTLEDTADGSRWKLN